MEHPSQSNIRPQPKEAFGHPVAKQHRNDEKSGFSEESVSPENTALAEEAGKLAKIPPYNPESAPRISLAERISGQPRTNEANP